MTGGMIQAPDAWFGLRRWWKGPEAAASAIPDVSAADRTFHRLVIENASDGLMRLSADWRRTLISPSCEEIFGHGVADILARPELDLVHPEDRSGLRGVLMSLGPDTPAKTAAWRGLHLDGRILWIEARYHHIPEDGGAIAILRDVTRARTAEDGLADARRRLERGASIDPLSGLPDRGAFLAEAGRMLAADKELALMMINLDHFRAITDTHGHATGDAVLRETAARLTRALAGEPIVARMGADEFAALIRVPNGDSGIAAQARDLIRVIEKPMPLGGANLRIGAAIGIAVCPRDGANVTDVPRNALIAIRHAKQAGGATYRFYEPAMGHAMERAAELRAELHPAIRSGQIIPWFQPMVRLEDMALAGYEVLPRWHHPGRGILEPGDFLPVAEEIGASSEVMTSLLRRACAIAHQIPPHVGLAVNISPRDLNNESLPDDIAAILAETGFDGSRLEVDVNEHALIHDAKIARRVLDDLRALGLSVALADFGAGYSSLWHLRALPFDKIKIDHSFMKPSWRDDESFRYVSAIIGLGHALGLELTAEGIEDETTLTRLRDLGCTYGQGAIFQGPMLASGLPAADGHWRQEETRPDHL